MTVAALPLEASARFERDRARFLRYADRPSIAACWLWQGHCERYGRFSLGLRKVWAHRAAWLLWRGDIPAGLFVLHTCDVKKCVNPRHLYLGTHADNVRDAVARQRYPRGFRVTHCPRGHELAEHGRINSAGYRECRTCRNAAKRRQRAGALQPSLPQTREASAGLAQDEAVVDALSDDASAVPADSEGVS